MRVLSKHAINLTLNLFNGLTEEQIVNSLTKVVVVLMVGAGVGGVLMRGGVGGVSSDCG